MSCNLQLQRNTKIFYSTVDLAGGAVLTAMTPRNTWQVEVLAGYAVSQATTTQDITPLESGPTPNRSTTRFNTAIEPVNWSFQTYIRPTGIESTTANNHGGVASSNSKPLADWFMWQSLFSNTTPAVGTVENSAWQNNGQYNTITRAGAANVAAHSANFGSAVENNLYILMDNIVYQVTQAATNEATVDAAIDSIATTSWTGFGASIEELTGTARNYAISVFGGVLNDGTRISGNSNAAALQLTAQYHPWATWNVAGTIATASFIKNRLSSINLNFDPEDASNTNYVFPVTSLSWTFNNNVTYLTPEELASLNSPIGNFAGARTISGSLTAYLRHNSGDTAQFLRNILNDTRVSHSSSANANVIVGGTSAPYVAFFMPAVQFSLPVHDIQDIISVTIDYQAQEPSDACGQGGEVVVFAKKS